MTDILPFPTVQPTPAAPPALSASALDRLDSQHLRIRARDIAAARRFYAAAVRPLGLDIVETREDGFILGGEDGPRLEVEADPGFEGEFDASPETRPAHVAIEAPDGFSVRAFYRAALEAGGRQVGYPAPQPTGGQGSYYSARVIDPDGNCIECGWRH